MHLVVDAQGKIYSRGKAMAKVIGDADRLADVFHFQGAPDGVWKMEATVGASVSEKKFVARLQNSIGIILRGSGNYIGDGLTILNFGFGVCLAEAVRQFDFKAADFSAADLAMEFLFLHEANRATMTLLNSVNTSLEQATADAHLQSLTDPLTGLLNRRAFDREFASAFRSRQSRPFALLHLDLDDFKSVNDNFGHHSGDLVLQRVSRIIASQIRTCDLAFRAGGDEFLILIFQPRSDADMHSLCLRLIEKIQMLGIDYPETSLSASVGVAMPGMRGASCKQIFGLADEALYAAKAAGKGKAIIFRFLENGMGVSQGANIQS